MENWNPSSITELINDYQNTANCYIICTIDGLMYDFGIIPTSKMCIERNYISFESKASGVIQFDTLDWSKLQKFGFDYDYSMDEDNGLCMAFLL